MSIIPIDLFRESDNAVIIVVDRMACLRWLTGTGNLQKRRRPFEWSDMKIGVQFWVTKDIDRERGRGKEGQIEREREREGERED